MKFIVNLMLLAMMFTTYGCVDEAELTGVEMTENRTVEDFDRISSSRIIDVDISQSSGPTAVTVITDSGVIDEVITTVVDGQLRLDYEGGSADELTINVIVSCPNIITIDKSGLGDLTMSGFNDLPSLTINQDGVGDIELVGSATLFTIEKDGIGDLAAYDFACENIVINQSGIGESYVNCSSSLSGSLSGIGDIYYRNMPSIAINVTGSGEVIDDN